MTGSPPTVYGTPTVRTAHLLLRPLEDRDRAPLAALNADQPFDEFTRDLIAGDLAVSPDQGTWVITSFGVANAISLPLTVAENCRVVPTWTVAEVGQIVTPTVSSAPDTVTGMEELVASTRTVTTRTKAESHLITAGCVGS